MAGKITENAMRFTADIIIETMQRCERWWSKSFISNSDFGCVSLFMKYGLSEDLWKNVFPSAAWGNADMAPFAEFKEKSRFCTLTDDFTDAIEKLEIYIAAQSSIYGCSLVTYLTMAGILGALKCFGKKLSSEEIGLFNDCRKAIEAGRDDISMEELLGAYIQNDKTELTVLLFVFLYAFDYENFRDIAKKASLVNKRGFYLFLQVGCGTMVKAKIKEGIV